VFAVIGIFVLISSGVTISYNNATKTKKTSADSYGQPLPELGVVPGVLLDVLP
jgi:hypothetical protein